MKTLYTLLLSFGFTSAAWALPNTPVLEECVNNLKVLYQLDNDQAAQACAHTDTEQELSLLEECVGDVMALYKFTQAQAVVACPGVSDIDSLETCISELEGAQGFDNDQAARVCEQRGS